MLYTGRIKKPKKFTIKRLKKNFMILLVIMIPDSVSIIFNKRLKLIVFFFFLVLILLCCMI